MEPGADQKAPATDPISQKDDVHNDVAAAIAQLKAKAQPEQAAEGDAPAGDDHPEPIAKQDHPNDPNRYADGTFKKTKAEAAAPPEKVEQPKQQAATQEIPSTDDQTKPSEAPSTAQFAAPVSWTAAEKAEFAKASPVVQAAVARREAEMNRGGQQWSEEKRRYEAVLAPVAQAFKVRNLSVEDGLNRLLSAQDYLDRDPAGAIAWLAQSYGVDLANLASNPPAPQPQPQLDPVVSHLTQHVSTLEQQLQSFLQSQTLGVVEKVAQSKPHWAAVENDLLRIIPLVRDANPGASHEEILEAAYEQAVWTNPQVRAQMLAEQKAAEEKAKADAVKAKAQQAAKAAVSVKGSSNGASAPRVPTTPSGGDIYDDVRAAIHQLRQQ